MKKTLLRMRGVIIGNCTGNCTEYRRRKAKRSVPQNRFISIKCVSMIPGKLPTVPMTHYG